MMEKLEKIKCNLCGNDDTKSVGFVKLSESQQRKFFVERLRIVQCKKCGLLYTNPRPSQDILKGFYDSDYSSLAQKDVQRELSRNKRLLCCGGGYVTFDSRFCKRLLSEITSLVGTRGKVLDVGCGEGRFIKFARDNGWKVFGQEVSSEAAKYAQSKFKLNVQQGDLRKLNFPKDYFDVVIMLNVIEHFTDPYGYLNEINRILKEDGLLYVSTPNLILPKQCIQLNIPGIFSIFQLNRSKKC